MDVSQTPSSALDEATVARLLAAAFPGAEARAVVALPGRNLNARVSIAGRTGPYLLRVHARGREAARVEWEVARLAYRKAYVPEIVWTSEDGGPEGRPCSILRWVEGETLAEVLRLGSAEDARQAAWAAGEALARVGAHTFREPGFLGPGLAVVEPTGRPSQAVRGAIEYCLFRAGAAERLGEPLAGRVWTFAMRYAHRLDRLADAACLVHGCYTPEHIVLRRVSGVWTVAAVVDWEDAFSGSPLWDVGALMRRVSLAFPHFADPFLKAFLKGGGEAPADILPLARLFDLVPLMQDLTRENLPPDRQEQTVAAVRATVDSLGQ